MSNIPSYIEAKDLYNFSFDEINAIQEKLNEKNVQIIDEAYRQGRINDNEHDYLFSFFHDGMGCYREVYRALYETFGQPENTCSFDPATGRVETDETGHIINYGLKVVTPFVNTRLDYQDKNNNPIYVIFPKMKSAERAIEKLEKEYGTEKRLKMNAALNRMFQDEDREAFANELYNLPSTTSKLHDILRLTISCKYFSDVERIKRKLSENQSGFFRINPDETRDRFEIALDKNEKKYYDIKMIMHLKDKTDRNFDVEIQLKIDTLMQGDLRTHKIYEELRELQAQLQIAKSRKGQRNELSEKQTEAKIKILTNRILQVNQNAIHQYNMMVLDKARRIEDDGYRPLQITPEYPDGTYKRCRNFISDEYLVESFAPFDGREAFSAKDDVNKLCFLRMIGKLPSDFDEFSASSGQTIAETFAALKPAEVARFNGINEVAERYQSVIRRKINTRHAQENPQPGKSGKDSHSK